MSPNLPQTGATIGRYVYANHYRDGLFSEVFRASLPDHDPATGSSKLVALKITTPSINTPPHDPVREARILSAAQSRHVIPLLETFQQPGGRFVLVFPFMPLDLSTLLHGRDLTDTSRRAVLRDMFKGLEYIHELGIIHRDVKPSNILLASPSGPAYLADMGIAWSPTDRSSEPADEKILDVGTTCYRPPELMFGDQAYGQGLDMWAAGCVAAQVTCLDSRSLFDAGDLGSELALIKSMFETLGTPDEDIWPETTRLPDWGKMKFKQYPGKPWAEILPDADADAVDLVSHLVVFESSRRMPASNALDHPYVNPRK